MPEQLTENDERRYKITYDHDGSEEVNAAYFVQDGELISFKNHTHKVVFAARRHMVTSIRDITEERPSGSVWSGDQFACSECGGPTWCNHNKAVS